jgi:hypothetical protein
MEQTVMSVVFILLCVVHVHYSAMSWKMIKFILRFGGKIIQSLPFIWASEEDNTWIIENFSNSWFFILLLLVVVVVLHCIIK